MAMPVDISQPELLNERMINALLDQADNVLMALPSPMMLLADELKVRGIDGCIAKPIS